MVNKLRTLSLVSLLFLVAIVAFPASASALNGADFKPGRIIDDFIFTNPYTMDANTIQAFLNAKVPVCDTWHAPKDGNNPPFICLKDYRQDVPAKAGEFGLCNGIGAGNKSSAQILSDV
jgi:hypothetical protein